MTSYLTSMVSRVKSSTATVVRATLLSLVRFILRVVVVAAFLRWLMRSSGPKTNTEQKGFEWYQNA